MKKRWKAAWISVFAAVAIAAQLFVFPLAQAAGTPTAFTFSGSTIAVTQGDYDGYKTEGTALTINQSGIYSLSGTCSDGSVTVKKGTTDVTLILDNLTLSSADSAPICFNKSTAVTLTAKEGSVNILSDTEKNNDETYADNLNAENAVIKCKDGSNVVIEGSGTIIIAANGKNGIKSGASTEEEGSASLTIKEVTLEINAPVNDAINAEASLAIESGSLTISAGDDAIHSDYALQIGTKNGENAPVINISSCYEGIEGANIRIDSGDITVHASDDGINAANGDLKGYAFTLDIAGGKIYIDTEKGDGIDSNGSLTISGGEVEVYATSAGGNAPLDSDGTFTIKGGTVLAVGNSGMAQTPEDGSQNYLIFTAGQTAGFGGGRNPFGNRGNMQQGGAQQGTAPRDMQNGDMGTPPEKPDGDMGTPPEKPSGDMNQNGSNPPEMPNGGMGQNGNQMPGGNAPQGTIPPDMPNNSQDGAQSGTLNISAGDSLEITDENGNVIYSGKAVRSANYVLYSSPSLSDSETYTLSVNGSEALSTTVSDSKNVRGFNIGRPNGGQGGMPSDDRFGGGQDGMTPPDMPNGGQQNKPNNGQNFVGGNENANADSNGSAFADVKNKDWFFNAVSYISKKGLMNGVSSTLFEPDTSITRGMFVTVLYRLENEPAVDGNSTFSDVSEDAYYKNAVIWATENGIASGVSDSSFAPEENITREQMAQMIYNYAVYKGKAIEKAVSAAYADSESVSDYAKSAVSWAAEKSIMTGDDNGLFSPKANATRAEAAAVFMRLSENMERL